jgi:hypothetical protein
MIFRQSRFDGLPAGLISATNRFTSERTPASLPDTMASVMSVLDTTRQGPCLICRPHSVLLNPDQRPARIHVHPASATEPLNLRALLRLLRPPDPSEDLVVPVDSLTINSGSIVICSRKSSEP